MYFTALSDLRGSMTVDVSGGISQSVNGRDLTIAESLDKDRRFSGLSQTVSRGVDTITPSLSAKLSASPSFNYAVLDTQDFYNGILTSIPESTIIHLLDQGWGRELLAPLVIESDDVRAATGLDGETFFRCYELGSETVEVEDTPLGTLAVLIENGVVDFNTFDPKKLKIVEDNVFVSGGTRRQLYMKWRCKEDAPIDKKSLDGSRPTVNKLVTSSARRLNENESVQERTDVSEKPTLKLRSTQGVIYAIGRHIRPKLGALETSEAPPAGIVFELECSNQLQYAVSTQYNGTICGIPTKDAESRYDSLKVLALLNQLINLQKSSKDKPSTQQVTVVE